jgi:hypothetical protein
MDVLDYKDLPLKSWYFEKVLNPEEIENYQFYNQDAPIYYTEDVDVNQIKGTNHSDYYGRTWLEMFQNLKRHKNVKDIEFIKSVILDPFRGGKGLIKLGSYYYINGGNHRYCHAKFFEMGKIPSDVTEYPFDNETFQLFTKLQEIGFTPQVKLSQKD